MSTNYLHGTEDEVLSWKHCSICGEWTAHETCRDAELCLGCDLLDAQVTRVRAREIESAMKAALNELAQVIVERDQLRAQLAALSELKRELAGGEATADLEADTGDLPKSEAA